jgi:sugar transferase (PEP-CTERM/EpsH1 system associated)
MHLLSSFQVGGAETVALELARAMEASSFRVLACSLTGPGPMAERFRAAQIEPLSLPHSRGIPIYDFPLAGRLARVLRREGVQVLHCHNSFSKLYGAVAGFLARVPAVVCTQHAVPSAGGIKAAHRLARLVNPLASHFVAVGRHVLGAATEGGYVLADRASVIYNGIDLSRFAPGRRERRSRDGELVIGCVGRLSEEKRHGVIFRAVAALIADHPRVRLFVVGDGPLRPVLEEEVERLDLEEHVAFLGLRSDVPELLGAMDVLVLASSTEGLPLVVIEAMASGLPIVATRVGGLPELVEEGRNGLLVPPDDPDALANALRSLLADETLRSRMGREGRRMAEERFSLAEAARRHARLYARLLGRTASGFS